MRILRPKLPGADRLVPYLNLIDQSRVYSNYGPLSRAFEERLESRFGLPAHGVTTVANATLGLALALSAQDAPRGTLCVMPAWTFIASVHAATMAGMIPYFVDVDVESWSLLPDSVSEAMAQAPGRVGAIMPVAPFGRPVDVRAWEDFRRRSGIPIVIDAAAGFDLVQRSSIPTVVSLHATKVLGVGEGGFVMCTDTSVVREVQKRANFGFDRKREAVVLGGNAKLSEYHAAVGLAAMDEWSGARDEWMAVAQTYRRALTSSNHVHFQDGFGQAWIGSTCVVRLDDGGADRTEALLHQQGIETRRWWGAGAHTQAATQEFPRCPLPVTEKLAASTIALPFYRDLADRDIERVVDCLSSSGNAQRTQ